MDSGVPQGTVMGPLLFLLFINDIPNNLSTGTTIRLFADDCLVYREIRSPEDQIQLQRDLAILEEWSKTWGMSFNPSKCTILRTRPGSKPPLQHFYTLHGQILKEVPTAKYLGVLLSNDLSWSPHVDSTAHKANQKLGFIRRNLRGSPTKSKCMAYTSVVRSGMEYASAIWDSSSKRDINKLEMVQRKPARWVKSSYTPTTSVTKLLQELKWANLADRRGNLRLILFYKIYHNYVEIPHSDIGLIPSSRPSRRNTKQVYRQRASTDTLKNSFALKTSSDWNILPDSTVSVGSVSNFKSQLTAQP